MVIHYTKISSQAVGAPWIVFIHGLTCDHTDWLPVIEQLHVPYNGLAVDLRGHGRSAHLPGPYSMRNLANDVVALIRDQLSGQPATLVSHSMGTRVAIAVSDELGPQVEHQVFVDGSRQASGEPENTRQSILQTLNDDQEYAEFADNLFGMMFNEKTKSAFGLPIIDRAKAISREVFRELLSEMHWFDCENLGQSLQQLAEAGDTRLTVLQSTAVGRDAIRHNLERNQSSEYLDMIRQIVPSSEITIVENTGHFIQIEQPQVIARVLGSNP